MSGVTTVIASAGKLPTLTAGKATPEVIAEFEFTCKNYFTTKDTVPEKQVATIMSCFQGVHIINWLRVEAEQVRVSKLTFGAFMKELRAKVLHPNWESNTRSNLLACTMKPDETFDAFHDRVIGLHSLLINTPSAMSDSGLRFLIDGRLVKDLQKRVHRDAAANAVPLDNLDAWIVCVKEITEVRENDIAEMDDRIEVQRRAEKRKANNGGGNEHKRPNSSGSASRQSSTAPASSTTGLTRCCPPITVNEKMLLHNHNRCFKCRLPYVYHETKACSNDFPAADGYKELTEEACVATAKRLGKPIGPASTAAVHGMPDVDDADDSSEDHSD